MREPMTQQEWQEIVEYSRKVDEALKEPDFLFGFFAAIPISLVAVLVIGLLVKLIFG
jgi:hypothetical protein